MSYEDILICYSAYSRPLKIWHLPEVGPLVHTVMSQCASQECRPLLFELLIKSTWALVSDTLEEHCVVSVELINEIFIFPFSLHKAEAVPMASAAQPKRVICRSGDDWQFSHRAKCSLRLWASSSGSHGWDHVVQAWWKSINNHWFSQGVECHSECCSLKKTVNSPQAELSQTPSCLQQLAHRDLQAVFLL